MTLVAHDHVPDAVFEEVRPQFNDEASMNEKNKMEDKHLNASNDSETAIDIPKEYDNESRRIRNNNNKSSTAEQGVKMDFYDLCYDVEVVDEKGNKKRKRLLRNVYGYCHPGE